MKSVSYRLIVAGVVLLLAGLLLWWVAPADLGLHHALLLARNGRWVRRAVWLTALGGFTVMGPIALIAMAVLLWRRRWRVALWLLLTVASGRLIVEGLKLIVRRPRPPVIDRLELVISWSFPSSHSAGTMITCAALALLWGRPAGWIAALFVALTIGWSRAALGVHWPSDVLAGWGCGLLWVGVAARWVPPGVNPLPSSRERVG